jgi:hypothetical protein
MLSGLGATMAQGLAFGTGSAIAHRAVDGVVGAMSGGGDSHEAAGPHAEAPTAYAQQARAPVCSYEEMDFSKCVEENGGNLAACQFQFDLLRSCKQTHSNTLSA